MGINSNNQWIPHNPWTCVESRQQLVAHAIAGNVVAQDGTSGGKSRKLASALANHHRVERVYFPGNYASEASAEARAAKEELFEKQCTGTGSMVTFIVRPNTRKAAYAVLNAVNIAHLAVSLGSTETLIQHPRSMTHSDMTAEDLDRCGITEGMIRLSVGLESSKDLIKDMLAALDAIQDEV